MLDLRQLLNAPRLTPPLLAPLATFERRFVEAAAALRAMAPQHQLTLERSSADTLDLIMDEALQSGFASPAHLVRACGAWFAALVAQHLGGQFVDLGAFPVFLRLPLSNPHPHLLYTSPLRLAIDAWERRQPRFAEAFEGLADLMDGLDRPTFVPFYDPADLDPTLETVWLLAQSLQVVLGRFEGGSWNLVQIPHNLRFVDAFLTDNLDPELQLRLASLSDQPRELSWWRARACGALFGEIVRQHLDARWETPQRGPHDLRVGPRGDSFSPTLLCQHAMEHQRGRYPLLVAYQALMDFIATAPTSLNATGEFPLAELRDPSLLTPLPPPPAEDDEDSFRLPDFSALQSDEPPDEHTQQVSAPDPPQVSAPDPSTQQYNPDALLQQLRPQRRLPADTVPTPAVQGPRGPRFPSLEFLVDAETPDAEWEGQTLEEPYRADELRLDPAPPPTWRPTEALDPAELDQALRDHPARPLPGGHLLQSGAATPLPVIPEATVQGEIPADLLSALRDPSATVQRPIPHEALAAATPTTSRGIIPTELLRADQRPRLSSPPPPPADPHPAADPSPFDFDWSMEDLGALEPAPLAESGPAEFRTTPLTAVAAPANPATVPTASQAIPAASRPSDPIAHDSTLAISPSADPRIAALIQASRQQQQDPGLARVGSTRRPTLDFQVPKPISSTAIRARAKSSPHGLLRDVHDHLRPVLVAADWTRLPEIVHRPLLTLPATPLPQLTIAIDFPDRLVYVNREDLDAWDVDLGTLLQVACSNLARSLPRFTDRFFKLDLPGRVFQLEIGDFYESSRVFLPGLVFAAQELLGTAELLLAIPNRNVLLMAAADDQAALPHLQGAVSYGFSSRPHPLSPHLFRFGQPGPIIHNVL